MKSLIFPNSNTKTTNLCPFYTQVLPANIKKSINLFVKRFMLILYLNYYKIILTFLTKYSIIKSAVFLK